jgi:ribonucleoside-diphosphate reductase alpha chain
MRNWDWSQQICKEIFDNKYKFHRNSPEEVFSDISKVISSVEKSNLKKNIEDEFFTMMIENKFIPAGRILANAWPDTKIRNFMNCFTIEIGDSMDGIFDALKEDAMISKVGGGVGFDISSLRPKGSKLSVGGEASGPVSFLKIFDASAKTIMTGGERRAAHIALLDISHPDVEEFITCKQGDKNKALTQFNISVKVTDKFIEAVEKDLDWDLVFEGKTYKTIKAKYLYDLLAKNAYEHNEPGIFNVDTVNRYNNGYWLYRIDQCNPCGEIMMEKYGVCCLGALNLTSFIVDPFADTSSFNFEEFRKTIYYAVRFLDNVLSVSEYPLSKIKKQVNNLRRIGLGFTGLGNAMAMLKIKYGSKKSKEFSEQLAKALRDYSYSASIELAKEKGKFPLCDNEKIIQSNFIKKLPKELIDQIKEHGLRNIGLNTCAPTGTISFSIGQNCSSGIEPIFALEYKRRIRTGREDEFREEDVYDFAWLKYKELVNKSSTFDSKIPEYFVTTKDILPKDGIDIQSIFQEYIDASISKTLNLPPNTSFEEYKELWMYGYKKGLKGFTTFNPDGSMKGILEYNEPKESTSGYIKRRLAPPRPDELECDIHQIQVKDQKIIVLTGKLNGSLYEIFVDDNSSAKIDVEKYNSGLIKKVKKGKYDLIVKNGEEKAIIENLSKDFGGTYGTLARLVSMALRHGTPLQFIVDQLSKSKEFVGFERAVVKVLKKYIKDGEKVMTSEACPDCKGELVFKEGCVTCSQCGWTQCI